MSSFEGTSRRNFRAETVSWLSQASEGAEIEGFIVSTAEKGALLSLFSLRKFTEKNRRFSSNSSKSNKKCVLKNRVEEFSVRKYK